MRKNRIELLLFLILAPLLWTSCSGVKRPAAIASELTTTMSLSASEIRVGEDVVVTIGLENQTPKDIVINFGNQQQIGYRVSTSGGVVIMEYPEWFQPASSKLVLPANEGRSFDLALTTTDLVPGNYVVRGGLLGHEAGHRWASRVLVIKP